MTLLNPWSWWVWMVRYAPPAFADNDNEADHDTHL